VSEKLTEFVEKLEKLQEEYGYNITLSDQGDIKVYGEGKLVGYWYQGELNTGNFIDLTKPYRS
jgi:hypothetical protein